MADSPAQAEPWDRQPGEPNRWFSRFERYRLAGSGRTLLGAVNDDKGQKGKKRQSTVPGSWSRAAARWRWKQRAEAWDEHERQKAREAHAKAIEEMNARHIQEAQALQSKGIQCLKALDANKLLPPDAMRFVTEGTKLERTARGEPESIEERRLTGKGGGPIGFSIEDAVSADKELEDWHNDRVQPPGEGTLPQGDPQVP